MDGSEISVVVLGHKGVGKSNFICECQRAAEDSEGRKRIEICGSKVAVKFVEDPERQRLVHALATVVLFDITNEASFAELKNLLDMAQHIAPAAFPAVLGTKADLHAQRKVEIPDVLAFCKTRPCPVPYYEVSKFIDESCVMALREILARPLINEHVLKATTDQEVTAFVHKTMKWAIVFNSGNILGHLRGLGYTIPAELMQEFPAEMKDYFFSEYPLQLVPKFFHPPLPELPAPSDDEDELCERDQPMSVVDVRPVLQVSSLYCMMWRDISLSCFVPSFLGPSNHYPIDQIVHINLSRNVLSSVPAVLFQLPNLESLDISHNEITALPGVEVWDPRSKLEVLIASHNLLRGDKQLPAVSSSKQQGTNALLFKHLWFIDLSHNNLVMFPNWVFHFPELSHIDIRYNEQITQLPTELCQLPHLDSILLEGLQLLDPPITVARQGLKTLKKYLQLKVQGSSPWQNLPVIVVGPEGSGKTSLLARLKGEDPTGIEPTVGLQITELKHNKSLISLPPLRSEPYTLDLWDFSGNPKYRSMYSCFPCHRFVHLLVFKQGTPTADIAHWLCEIYAMSAAHKAKVPVILVFTHTDRLRGSKVEEYRSEMEKFLNVKASSAQTSKSDDLANLTMSLQSTAPIPLNTAHQGREEQRVPEQGGRPDRERGNEWERDTFLLSALSSIVKLFFVSGENVSNLKKYLQRLATAKIVLQNTRLIGQDVPQAYFRIEQQIKELRLKYRFKRGEGGGEGSGARMKPFFTFWEVKRLLQPLLNEYVLSDSDFKCALKFLHEASIVYIYECTDGAMIIAPDPELVGQLLQRTISAVYAKNGNAPLRLMSTQDLCTLWCMAGSMLPSQDTEVSFQQVLEFLTSVDVCAPLHSGISIFPIVAPQLSLKQHDTSLNLVSRRVYLFSYLPALFFNYLAARIILSHTSFISEACPITSLSMPTLNLQLVDAFRMSNGSLLQIWANALVLRNNDGSAVMISVARGKEVGPDALTCYGKVDVKLCASSLQEEARLLRYVSSVIDNLLELKYPVIYNGPNMLEICVPILTDPTNCSLSSDDASKPAGIPISIPQKVPTPTTSPNASSLPVGSYLSSTTNEGSWEVLSRRSSFTAKFTLCQDVNSTHSLVPVWECIQQAMSTPVTRFCGHRIMFQEVIPDLLYADLPRHCIYRATQSQSGNVCLPDMEDQDVVPSDVSGLRLKKYYTMNEDDVYRHRSADAQRTFCLKDFLAGTRNDFKKLTDLKCPYIISPVGINFCPLVLALEGPPHGTLRNMIRADPSSMMNSFVHSISLQVLSALQYLHEHGLHYHSLTSENVFVWSLDPASIKLGEAGIVCETSDCMLCSYLNTIEDKTIRKSVGNQIDFILLGCLEYEMATGKRPFENVYNLDVLVMAILHSKLKINIEAHLTVQSQQQGTQPHITGCHRMCLQSIADECLHDPPRDPTSLTVLGARLSLCAGNSSWVPMRMLVNVECLVCSEDASLVYWSSGSRGLVTGVLEPKTGELTASLLQEAPTPESGLFAHKRGKPIPIAVGHTTALDMTHATQQLWVGTENGLLGSVYVFNLPDMRLHHHLHLQDAVLSLCALNGCGVHYGGDEMRYRVLLGLANGTIILFFGINQGKVVPNPLQGPKLQIFTTGRKPCLNMSPTSNGYIWCSCGDSLELLDIVSLKSLRRLDALVVAVGGNETPRGFRKGEVIMLMATNALGIWTVTRRSTVLRLWDSVTGALKASYNVRNVLAGEDHDITALMTHGAAMWLGTRTGYILLLNPSALVDGQNPLLGLQHCGKGKIKFIRPLVSTSKPSSRLEVVCSLEYEDEVSGVLFSWEFHPLQQWRAKEHHLNSGSLPTSPTSILSPVHSNVQLSMSA